MIFLTNNRRHEVCSYNTNLLSNLLDRHISRIAWFADYSFTLVSDFRQRQFGSPKEEGTVSKSLQQSRMVTENGTNNGTPMLENGRRLYHNGNASKENAEEPVSRESNSSEKSEHDIQRKKDSFNFSQNSHRGYGAPGKFRKSINTCRKRILLKIPSVFS